MANLEKVIIISDYDGGYHRTIYKDGKIYGKSRLMCDTDPLTEEIKQIAEIVDEETWSQDAVKQIQKIFPDYLVILCQDGGIDIGFKEQV
jgi:hypothetical protein